MRYNLPVKVSFNQPYENVRDTNGYGYAAKMCKQSLVELGHQIAWRDATADVEINFIQPDHWHWTGPYRIAYLPWESTKLREHWVPMLNEVDEVWTPSPVIADWMAADGVTKEIKVYQHGVEPAWYANAHQRDTTGTFEIMHHGAEALRKGGNDTIAAFIDTLWEEDARLTLKLLLQRFNIHDTKHIRVMKTKIPFEELVALYESVHLLCYPSYGEGFGLAPLQAMATGMPVLISKGWAPYEYLLPEESLIETHLIDSPWPDHHPGQVLQPNLTELREKLVWHYENRDQAAKVAFEIVDQVIADYNWLELTEKAFKHLV